jgi:hypothetical protein
VTILHPLGPFLSPAALQIHANTSQQQGGRASQALLALLGFEFSAWQAQSETGAGWGLGDVLAMWRRKGLVVTDLGGYHFPEDRWRSQ